MKPLLLIAALAASTPAFAQSYNCTSNPIVGGYSCNDSRGNGWTATPSFGGNWSVQNHRGWDGTLPDGTETPTEYMHKHLGY